MRIALQGCKNSGKDVAAKYINYLYSTPKIFHYYWFGNLINFKWFWYKFKIVKYADKLKQMLAVLLNLQIDNLEDRNIKENYYCDFNTMTINNSLENRLNEKQFAKQLLKNNKVAIDYNLSIRQILQYFGTEIMRKHFGDKLWILNTLNKDNIIIADQRFKIENEVAKQLDTFIIHVHRESAKYGYHASERELLDMYEQNRYDVLLLNNDTLKHLFNNIKTIIYETNLL